MTRPNFMNPAALALPRTVLASLFSLALCLLFAISTGEANTRSPAGNNAAAARAVKAALDKNWQAAFDGASRTGDLAALKTVEWLYLRKNPKDSGPERIMNFVAANPSWPSSRPLTRAAERTLASQSTPVDLVARHFQRFTPVSAAGHVAFARLALSRGDRAGAATALRKAWLDPKLSKGLEKQILQNFRGLLSADDHKARMYAMIMAQETNAAVRAAGRISRAHVQAAKAAQALIRRRSNGPKLYKKLSSGFQNHPPLVYAYSRWFRRNKRYESAYAVLKRGPASHSAQIRPDQWFVEKRLAARHLAAPKYRKHWRGIYKMLANHGFTTGKHFIEAEFLAGWYALRKLSNPGAAAVHFKRVAESAKTRTNGSKGWYWLGRARAAKGERTRAAQAYKQAAASPTLFYGQLAREKLGLGKSAITIRGAKSEAGRRASVRELEVLRAAQLLLQAGGKGEANAFLFPVARAIKSAPEAATAIDLIHSQGGYFPAVRLAKAFGSLGIDVDNWAYPVNALPKWRTIANPVEKAVVLGLSRQESEFNARAGSHAGAKGLMQIMPGTGKVIARQYRIRGYRTSTLVNNPPLNVAMGEAYLGDLIKKFDGSYILAFAGYNAGPGNARKWINIYGDPRSSRVDAIDWIESIPITETRKYVQKVMQNVQVYRTRLNTRKVTISRDINRGGSYSAPRTVTTGTVQPAADCGNGAGSINALLNKC